jgi:hypothetical protein
MKSIILPDSLDVALQKSIFDISLRWNMTKSEQKLKGGRNLRKILSAG